MRLGAAVFALLLASLTASANGQRSDVARPAKLILREGQAMLSIDYASMSRCEAAREVIATDNARRQESARRDASPGSIIIPSLIRALCIPG